VGEIVRDGRYFLEHRLSPPSQSVG